MDFDPPYRNPPSDADRSWYAIVRRVVAIRERLAHTRVEYIERCLESEANGQVPILPTPEEVDLMLLGIDDNTCDYVRGSLDLIVQYRDVLDHAANLIVRANVGIDLLLADNDEEEESSGIQFSASQVDDFLQTLPRVEISTLELEEVKCSICKLDYGTQRGNTTSTETGLESGQGLPGEEEPEQPVELFCGHVFGEWCIKTWLLEQPASCPTCRLQFEPILE